MSEEPWTVDVPPFAVPTTVSEVADLIDRFVDAGIMSRTWGDS